MDLTSNLIIAQALTGKCIQCAVYVASAAPPPGHKTDLSKPPNHITGHMSGTIRLAGKHCVSLDFLPIQ